MQGNGGTTLWTAAAGQTTWQLRAGAWRIYNVPVCLSKGGRCHSRAATCYQPAEWFLLLPGLWRTPTSTQTHTHRVMMGRRRLETLPVRAFCLSLNELKYVMCVYVRACLCACDRKTAGDREQWPVTYWRSQDTSIRGTGAYAPSFLSNPACPHTTQACFVSRPPALSSDPSLKSHPEWQPASIASFILYTFPSIFLFCNSAVRDRWHVQVQLKFLSFSGKTNHICIKVL